MEALLDHFKSRKRRKPPAELKVTGKSKAERVQREYEVIITVLRRLGLEYYASYNGKKISSIYVRIPDGAFENGKHDYWRLSNHTVPRSPERMEKRRNRTDMLPRRPHVFVTGALHRRPEFWDRVFMLLCANRAVRIKKYSRPPRKKRKPKR